MKIGVVSDTHGCVDTWRALFKKYFFDANLIIHAGDVLYHGPRNVIPAEYNPKLMVEELNSCPVPLIIARGNCDAEVDGMVLNMPIQAPYAYVVLNGLRIVVNHGHTMEKGAIHSMAQNLRAAIYITGHTHISELYAEGKTIFLNPGSPAMTKRSDDRKTIAIIDDICIRIVDVHAGEVLAELATPVPEF